MYISGLFLDKWNRKIIFLLFYSNLEGVSTVTKISSLIRNYFF